MPRRRRAKFAVLAISLITLSSAGSISVIGEAGADTATVPHLVRIRPVLLDLPNVSNEPISATANLVATCKPASLQSIVNTQAVINPTRSLDDLPAHCVALPRRNGTTGYFLGKTTITGASIKSAETRFATGQGWSVLIRFTRHGSKAFDRLAARWLHKRLATTLDGVVLNAPVIQPDNEAFQSYEGIAVISSLDKRDAKTVARAINAAR